MQACHHLLKVERRKEAFWSILFPCNSHWPKPQRHNIKSENVAPQSSDTHASVQHDRIQRSKNKKLSIPTCAIMMLGMNSITPVTCPYHTIYIQHQSYENHSFQATNSFKINYIYISPGLTCCSVNSPAFAAARGICRATVKLCSSAFRDASCSSSFAFSCWRSLFSSSMASFSPFSLVHPWHSTALKSDIFSIT